MNQAQARTVETIDAASTEWGGAGVADYWALLKPRVMSLVVFTAMVGVIVAPGGLHPVLAFAAILSIAVAAGASGALNMWYEADIDAKMRRTAHRPIPAGRVSRGEALGFGISLGVGAVASMGLFVNVAAAALLAVTILFYVVVYTMWLKRRTPQNIVIGGAAGALPPLVGWAAVTGSVDVGAIILFAIIFFWTPPHFWALALGASNDYARAGVPMMPVVAGEKETRRQIFLYALILAPLGLAPWFVGLGGPVYAVVSALAGTVFVFKAWAVLREHGATSKARALFGFSILYLFVLFATLAGEKLAGGGV